MVLDIKNTVAVYEPLKAAMERSKIDIGGKWVRILSRSDADKALKYAEKTSKKISQPCA